MHGLAFDNRSEKITATSFAKSRPTETSTEDAIAGKGGQKVVKEAFELIL